MKRTIFLHIGFGKTGTTSIQKTLLTNRDLLLKRRILYPRTGIVDGGHHELALVGVEEFSVSLRELYQDLINEIESSDAEQILISSENFCFMKEEYINSIFSFLNNYNIKIIFYIRNQADLIKSSYLQWIKVGASPVYKNINEFWRAHKNSFIFQNRLIPYIAHCERESFNIQIFDKETTGNDVVQHFLKNNLSIERSQLLPIEILVNESLVEEFIDFAMRINKIEEDIHLRQKSIRRLVEASSYLKSYSRNTLISSSLKAQINEFYYDFNREFVKTFFKESESDFIINLIER